LCSPDRQRPMIEYVEAGLKPAASVTVRARLAVLLTPGKGETSSPWTGEGEECRGCRVAEPTHGDALPSCQVRSKDLTLTQRVS